MTVLQRGLYRNILERNAAAIRTIVQASGSSSRNQPTKNKKSGSFLCVPLIVSLPLETNSLTLCTYRNILMELRKSLCHPYLVDVDMEPLVASARDAHRNLTEASAKLILLARMLPRLKAAGHRVLIVRRAPCRPRYESAHADPVVERSQFSQFKITLNILERFLSGLDIEFLRLDGDTPQLDRQRGASSPSSLPPPPSLVLLLTPFPARRRRQIQRAGLQVLRLPAQHKGASLPCSS